MTPPHEHNDPEQGHPDDAHLLAYLDGELPPDEHAATSAHFDRCWTCRSRRTALQADIDTFLRARLRLLPDDVGPPRSAALRRRLAAHVRVPEPALRRPLAWIRVLADGVGRPGGRLRGSRLRELISTPTAIRLATCCVGMILLIVWLNVSVSASRVLEQAAAVERAQAEQPSRVAHALLALERVEANGRSTRVASLDTAADAATARRRILVQRADGAETRELVSPKSDAMKNTPLFAGAVDARVLGYLDRQRWMPILSIAEYRKVIAGRGAAAESGRRTWNNLFELRHVFAAGHDSRLVESRLWLDGRTYEPTRMSLFFEDGGRRVEYRLTRLLFEQLPRTAAWARVFSEPRLADASAALPESSIGEATELKALPAPPVQPEPDAPLAWSDTPATDLEVAVVAALRAMGADREEINLFATSRRRLLIQGVVRDDARRAEVIAALTPFPDVRVELYLRGDRSGDAVRYPAPWVLHPAPWLTASEAMALVRLSSSDGRADAPGAGPQDAREAGAREIETETLRTLSAALFVEAWAWQRLEVEFAAARAADLSPASVNRVDELRRDYRASVARAAAVLRDRLRRADAIAVRPEIAGATDASITTASPDRGDLASDVIVGLTAEQYVLLRDLLRASTEPTSDVVTPASTMAAPAAPRRLFAVLDTLVQQAEES